MFWCMIVLNNTIVLFDYLYLHMWHMNLVFVIELYFSSMMWWCVFCWQFVILMCCILGVFCLAWRILVELNVVWGFPYLETQLWLFRLCEAVERDPFCLCEAVVEDWSECCTLSPVQSSGERKDVSPYFGSLRV